MTAAPASVFKTMFGVTVHVTIRGTLEVDELLGQGTSDTRGK